jgi:hypothetical protein
VEHRGGIEIVGRADPKGESCAGRFRTFAQDQAVMNELLVTAEIDRVVVL